MDIQPQIPGFPDKDEKPCVYCSNRADTKDHAPPRCLLKRPLPSNLITFPACQRCNSGFSFDENVVRSLLELTSDHPDLVQERQPGGRLSRALERDGRLRSIFDRSRREDGTYLWTDELALSFQRVFIKTMQGMFFGLYEQIVPKEKFALASIHHRRDAPVQSIIDRLRPSPLRDITDEPLPDLTPHGWPMRQNIIILPVQSPSGASEHRVFKLIRETPVEWFYFQPKIFNIALIKCEDGSAAFVLDLWETLTVVVKAPWPGRRGRLRRGKRNPDSRN